MSKKRKQIKNCPICGDANIMVYRSISKKIKPWFLHCEYCRHSSESAQTMRGAIRKWNKGTNILNVSERKG